MAKIRHLEDDLQRAVWTWFQMYAPDCIAFAVPNGGRRNVREAARLKAMGVLPGVADFILLWEGGSGAIELKVEGGRQRPAQKVFQHRCEARSIPYRICRSLEDVEAACKEWGLLINRPGSAGVTPTHIEKGEPFSG